MLNLYIKAFVQCRLSKRVSYQFDMNRLKLYKYPAIIGNQSHGNKMWYTPYWYGLPTLITFSVAKGMKYPIFFSFCSFLLIFYCFLTHEDSRATFYKKVMNIVCIRRAVQMSNSVELLKNFFFCIFEEKGHEAADTPQGASNEDVQYRCPTQLSF